MAAVAKGACKAVKLTRNERRATACRIIGVAFAVCACFVLSAVAIKLLGHHGR